MTEVPNCLFAAPEEDILSERSCSWVIDQEHSTADIGLSFTLGIPDGLNREVGHSEQEIRGKASEIVTRILGGVIIRSE